MLNLFLNSLKADDKSAHTIKAYETDIRLVLNDIDKSESEITYSDLEIWRQNAIHNFTKATINRKITSVKVYFNFLEDMKLIPSNPSSKLKMVRVKDTEKEETHHEYLTLEESTRLLDGCVCARDKAIIAVGLTTALRFNEIRNLTLEDYDAGTIKVITKGSKYRLITFNETCKEYIDEYLNNERNSDSKYLFLSNRGNQIENSVMNRVLANICDRVGLPKRSMHDLRHTSISEIAKNFGVAKACHWVGHSSVQITQRYVHSADKEITEMSNVLNF